jgi:hypothetical protein
MAVQTQLEYERVIPIGRYLSRTEALDETGKTIVNISWYLTKLWVQERGLYLPTSSQWSLARAFFEEHFPEIEEDMIDNKVESTDSLIAWPNPENGIYASNIIPIPTPGKVPLLIEDSFVEKTPTRYVIYGGERKYLPDLPTHSGILKNPIVELGLIKGAYLWSDSDFNLEDGLRFVIRSVGKVKRTARIYADAERDPSYHNPGVAFRPAQRK